MEKSCLFFQIFSRAGEEWTNDKRKNSMEGVNLSIRIDDLSGIFRTLFGLNTLFTYELCMPGMLNIQF